MSVRMGITAAALISGLVAPAAFADMSEAMNQLPAPVRVAIEREASGGKVEAVDDLSDDGQLFKVAIEKNDEEHELYIDASGRVVGRVVESCEPRCITQGQERAW